MNTSFAHTTPALKAASQAVISTGHHMPSQNMCIQVYCLLGVLVKEGASDKVVHDQKLTPCQLTLLYWSPPTPTNSKM